ncbi:MAG: helix-turn-helix transcriptional regulator [Bdellovibrionales bacterium]|nr:helix-turn-helix transcriptional regulator [Oligoflexia bacterium]
MRKLHHPLPEEIEISNVLYALGDPIRLKIVQALAALSERGAPHRSCKNVCEELKLSKSTLSHHFRILRESGLIECEKEGTQYINTLRLKVLQKRFPGLLKCILKAYQI